MKKPETPKLLNEFYEKDRERTVLNLLEELYEEE